MFQGGQKVRLLHLTSSDQVWGVASQGLPGWPAPQILVGGTLADPLLSFFLVSLKTANSRHKGRLALPRSGSPLGSQRGQSQGQHGLLEIPEAMGLVQAPTFWDLSLFLCKMGDSCTFFPGLLRAF